MMTTTPPAGPELAALLNTTKARIEPVLLEILKSKVAQADQIDPIYSRLLTEIMSLMQRGGKRLRPALTLLTYEGYGGRYSRAITKVAVSQELFHAFLLMHDDIIDRDTVRWGGPNLTGRYLTEFNDTLPPADARHFAESWALLGGDVCLNLAQEVLLNSGFPAESTLRAAACLNRTLFETIGGELLDVALPLTNDAAPTEQQLLKVCHYKTASYSFQLPLTLGALFAGAEGKQALIEQFATCLGIAFQLQDDILGMFGDEKTLGKSILTDLHEGKQTLLILYGLQSGSTSQVQVLKQNLGNANASYADLESIRSLLVATGARERVVSLAQQQARQAKQVLSELGVNELAAKQLEQLVDFVTERSH